jgi:arylsulfatase A-like enzyme
MSALGNAAPANASSNAPARAVAPRPRLRPVEILLLAASCGLAAGWLEVGTRIIARWIEPTGRLYMMTRHFVWLVPLSDLALFVGVGTLLAAAAGLAPRAGRWLGPRVIGALWILPTLIVAGPRVHAGAWLVLALGIASWMALWLERSRKPWRRWMLKGSLGMLLLVLVTAATVFGGDWLSEWHQTRRPQPPAGSPNVLFVVLDTVRADHLSLYGYRRATTPFLEQLGKRGIRFEAARATAPWTLPSHASMFTGHWPFELAAKWKTPLERRFPTLAEYLLSRGYATAGFVANTLYCSYDAGLDRGFVHYEDYVFDLDRLRPLRTAVLVDRGLDAVAHAGLLASRVLGDGALRRGLESVVRPLLANPRKNAAIINSEFLTWWSRRRQPERPFFAFLNYLDAHEPYVPPAGTPIRFGAKPLLDADLVFLVEQWSAVDKGKLPRRYVMLAEDAYDNCLAYLDERLGELFSELERRGVLSKALVIITADHGEAFGEHDLYDHGESLYRPEIRVPLLVVLPEGRQRPAVAGETVSLRDLPATIVDQVGLAAGSPFPGRSIIGSSSARSSDANSDRGQGLGALAELDSPNPLDPSSGRSPAARGGLASLALDGSVYIRNEGTGREELYIERDDPRELLNRAAVDAMRPVLERLRERLAQIRRGAVEP